MSSIEHTQAPENSGHRDEELREENRQSTGDHSIAAEAARRQARQDPLQG